MSENTPDFASDRDAFAVLPGDLDWDAFADLPEDLDFDFDAYVGEPPEWYFPLVGKVAVAAGGLELTAAEVALHLLGWSSTSKGGQSGFWASSAARLVTLLDAAKGLSPEFDRLVGELHKARELRNQIVHVVTGWHDFDTPHEPSGWHYENPKTGSRVYLDNAGARPTLERALASIIDLDQRMWQWHTARVAKAEGVADWPAL